MRLRDEHGEVFLSMSPPMLDISCRIGTVLRAVYKCLVQTIEGGFNKLVIETDSCLAFKPIKDGKKALLLMVVL